MAWEIGSFVSHISGLLNHCKGLIYGTLRDGNTEMPFFCCIASLEQSSWRMEPQMHMGTEHGSCIASSNDRSSGDQGMKCSFHLISEGAWPIAEGWEILSSPISSPFVATKISQMGWFQWKLELKGNKIMRNKLYWWMVILHFKSRGKIQIFHL